jgi:integrase/recombinase XerD
MTFSYLVTSFFRKYLTNECGHSPNTIASYSDGIKLLIHFACERFAVEPEGISIEKLSRELITDFLDDLETNRGNGVSTRNQRLAAIKTFFRFLARDIPEMMHLNERIQAIREKRTDYTPPPSLTLDEVNAIIAVPDPNRLLGARDKALLKLLYNSGARVQEIADLQIGDLHRGTDPTVKLTGKGGKTRIIPLREDTVNAINHYLNLRSDPIELTSLFLNIKGQPMTRFGIGRRVQLLASQAARNCPSLKGRRITPHVFRHTIALHLIESDGDIVSVKRWLGHADIRTASPYVEVSVERKRRALEKVPSPEERPLPEAPRWKEPGLMQYLDQLSHRRSVMLRSSG